MHRNSIAREVAREASRSARPLPSLTKPQRDTLKRVANPVPARMTERGFPGWPQMTFDNRALNALERRGLVQSRLRDDGTLPLCFVLTDAGREALAALSD